MKDTWNFFVLGLLIWVACILITLVPAPEEKLIPIDPVGEWEGSQGGNLVYAVTVKLVDKDTWNVEWYDALDVLAYTGTLTRRGDKFNEQYLPPGRQCNDWTWQRKGDDLDDTRPNGWILKRVKVIKD